MQGPDCLRRASSPLLQAVFHQQSRHQSDLPARPAGRSCHSGVVTGIGFVRQSAARTGLDNDGASSHRDQVWLKPTESRRSAGLHDQRRSPRPAKPAGARAVIRPGGDARDARKTQNIHNGTSRGKPVASRPVCIAASRSPTASTPAGSSGECDRLLQHRAAPFVPRRSNAGRGLRGRSTCGYDGQGSRLAHIPTGSTTATGCDKKDFGSMIKQRNTP